MSLAILLLFIPGFLCLAVFIAMEASIAIETNKPVSEIPNCISPEKWEFMEKKREQAKKFEVRQQEKKDSPTPAPAPKPEEVKIKSVEDFVKKNSTYLVKLLEGPEGCIIIPTSMIEGYNVLGIIGWMNTQERVDMVAEVSEGLAVNIADPF